MNLHQRYPISLVLGTGKTGIACANLNVLHFVFRYVNEGADSVSSMTDTVAPLLPRCIERVWNGYADLLWFATEVMNV